MEILFATSNKGKIIEILECTSGLPQRILTLNDLSTTIPQPEETGETFAENAELKARHYFDATQIPTFADDSGIIVEALSDELGIHTRRWGAGAEATDEEWIDYFLKRMAQEKNKRAAFVCSIAYVDPQGTTHSFEGRCEGTIADNLEADYLPGLPISAVFRPVGYDKVFSALTIEQKNNISHRGRAVQELVHFLNTQKI